MSRLIGLADCNNFYVSCERVFNPSLIGKPVIVLSNNDGSAIARSQEAKNLGIRMGQNVFGMRELIENEGVVTLSSNYTLYADMSERVVKAVQKFIPSVEIYSIDEMFLELEHIEYSVLENFLLKVKKEVLKLTGIPISIGVGRTKTLSKVANKLAKLSNGVYIETQEQNMLLEFPLSEVWGIGARGEQKLKKIGCTMVPDFLSLPESWIRKNLTISGLRTQQELLGVQCHKLEKIFKQKKSISTSRTFGRSTSDFLEVQKAVHFYLEKCVKKMKSESLISGKFTLHLSNDKYKNEIYYEKNISFKFLSKTNSLEVIWPSVQSLLFSIFDPTISYRKAGISFSDLCENKIQQISFFQEIKNSSPPKQPSRKNWVMRREFLSKKYTTCWDELPEISSVIFQENYKTDL